MNDQILSLAEIEVFVSNMKTTKLHELGELSWFETHKRLHMIYQEALLETINEHSEITKESFLLHGKVKDLVYESICLSVWRLNVFPKLSQLHEDKEKIFPVFVMLYHEVTAFGLLESLTFHSDCVESLQDAAVELIDYCFQNILQLINRKVPEVLHERLSELSPQAELEHHEANIVHSLGIRAISVLRFIAEALESLPLSAASWFYQHHDIPMILCQVIELAPWYTSDADGKKYHFVDGNWKRRERSDGSLNKSEGQTWLCVRQVVLDQRFQQYYELNDFRTRHLSKLIRYLHDEMIDQLFPLAELKHFLCQLSVAKLPPPQSRPLILELTAQFKEQLMRQYSDKWNKLARKQADIIRNMDITQIQSIASGLAEAYTTLDLVEPEPARCANCGDPAAKRCSRCKNEWYCGRECQVKMWNKHKPICITNTD